MSGVTTLAFRQELLKQRFLGFVPEWTAFELALTRRVPTTNSAVAQLNEPVGGAYARARLPLDDPSWDLINDNEVANAIAVYFPTATSAWGTLHGWAAISYKATAWSAGNGPKVMAVGTLNTPLRVLSGVRPYLGAGDVVFGMYD